MDLSLFYEEFQEPKTTILEIPTYRLDILINKMGLLIANSKEEKAYTLDISQVEPAIHLQDAAPERRKSSLLK